MTEASRERPSVEKDAGARTLRSGDVVRYEPAEWPGRHDRMWCREGTAIVREDGALVDTYWGSGSDNYVLDDVETETARVAFNLADYDEIHRGSLTWEDYHPDDRGLITSQHGLQSRLFIRRGAQPDLATQIETAREALAEAEQQVKYAERTVGWRRERLAELEATTPLSPGAQS